jgi:hypothetical protein
MEIWIVILNPPSTASSIQRSTQYITSDTTNTSKQANPTFHSLHCTEQHTAHHLQQTDLALHNLLNTEQHADHTYTIHYLQHLQYTHHTTLPRWACWT